MNIGKSSQFLDQTAMRLKALEAPIAKVDGKLVEDDIAARRIEADAGFEFAMKVDEIDAALRACGHKLDVNQWCKQTIGVAADTMRRRRRLASQWPVYVVKREAMGQCGLSGLRFALSLVSELHSGTERPVQAGTLRSASGTKSATSIPVEHGITGCQFITGDALVELRKLATQSVNTIITSPPYWRGMGRSDSTGIGTETTVGAYITNLVAVLREGRRVLRDDGTLWIHIDDSYIRRDLQFIPARLGIALSDDGWIARANIIRYKITYRPEPVIDRPTKDYDTVLLLTKKRDQYFYDADLVRLPGRGPVGPDKPGGGRRKLKKFRSDEDSTERFWPDPMGRNLGMVWPIRPSRPYRGKHPATMPLDLAERCVLLGCPENGTVLDPFGGVATSALAALLSGRLAISIEINPEYAEEGQQRMATQLGVSTPDKRAAD